jgi:hypothetical protein
MSNYHKLAKEAHTVAKTVDIPERMSTEWTVSKTDHGTAILQWQNNSSYEVFSCKYEEWPIHRIILLPYKWKKSLNVAGVTYCDGLETNISVAEIWISWLILEQLC